MSALLAFGLLLVVGSAGAAPGALDPGFGVSGVVSTAVGTGGDATSLLLQPDGKLVAVGESVESGGFFEQISLARYQSDGSLDPTFGDGGIVETPMDPGGIDLHGPAAALQPDGKIVVAVGHPTPPSGGEFALVRYNADGSLDSTFGSGGIVETQVGAVSSEDLALALEPDGKIVAAGAFSDSSSSGSALARYLPNGDLDPTFGSGGVVRDARIGQNGFDAVAILPGGQILATGSDTAITRYDADGTPGTTFSGAGVQLVVQPDGKILVDDGGFTVTRLKTDGSADTSFGNDGTTTSPVDPAPQDRSALTLQPDGKILVAGSSKNGGPTGPDQFTLVRYNADGSVDLSFGAGGAVSTLAPSWMVAAANAVAVQQDGKIDVAGEASLADGGTYVFALTRYQGSTLTVEKVGSGAGSVTSSPAAITCGATCSAPVAAGPVTLTATPAASSIFTGWSGGGCTGTSNCTVQMSADQTVTATFSLGPQSLTITTSGAGSGTVVSTPIGIGCDSTCSQEYAYGTTVNLTATPGLGSAFKGWTGACSGTGSCSLTMKQEESVTAEFAPKPKPNCIVPNLKGKPLTTAQHMIKKAHCRTGTIRKSYSNVTKGHVIAQTPHPQRHLRNDAKVNLTISKGKRP